MAGPTTPGLTGLLRGEDWHYVGESGEPAFISPWENTGAGRNLAFRIRETGIVDIQGDVTNADAPTAPSGSELFTLPVGYRPSADTYQGVGVVITDAGEYVAVIVAVSTAGVVSLTPSAADPIAPPVFRGSAVRNPSGPVLPRASFRPMSRATWLPDALNDEALTVVEHPGWDTRPSASSTRSTTSSPNRPNTPRRTAHACCAPHHR